MSFFDDLPEPPEPEPERTRPAWSGPPANQLGVGVPLRILLARTERVAMALDGVVVYSTGFGFSLAGRLRRRSGETDANMAHRVIRPPRAGTRQLLVGVRFSDGRRATGDLFLDDRDDTPAGPVLLALGGRSGGRTFDVQYWVWPLPPEGPLTIVCRWEEEGIDETRVEVDAAPILRAAAGGELLWPDDDDGPGGVTWNAIGFE